jgi:cysteine desulfurase
MLANNETGVIFPLKQVCEIARGRGVPVHTDAVNALGKMPVNVDDLGVSMLSLSAHKIHGPKGAGALYVRRGTPFRPMMIGGSQERGRRGGTLNAPGIVGLGKACALLATEQQTHWPRMQRQRDTIEQFVREKFPTALIAGGETDRLPNTVCACFEGVGAEACVLLLSEGGVCVSSGAACSSGSLEPSHVMQAMDIPPHVAQGQIRFSVGRETSEAEIDRALEVLPAAIEKVAAVGV